MTVMSWVQDKIRTLGRRLRAALVPRGGPENGPFSAMAGKILAEELPARGIDIQAIYASSGAVPTAMIGCTGDWSKLCDIWANLRPENIVSEPSKSKTAIRMAKSDLAYAFKKEPLYESFFDHSPLRELMEGNYDPNKISSPEALLAKFPAVDLLSNEYIIFSNKAPGHIRWFLEGALGSMGLVPFMPPTRVYNPEEAGLIEKGRAKDNSLLLIDGGFMGNMLLEEATRDGYDIIFLIDIHGLQPAETNFDVKKRQHWAKLLRSAFHLLSCTNDRRQFQMDDRINEEIRIKQLLLQLSGRLPLEYAQELRDIVQRMNQGRLRLGDKEETKVVMVANPERSNLFNFTSFTQHKETLELMDAAREATYRMLQELDKSSE